MAQTTKKTKKKIQIESNGVAHVKATFNNVIITITDSHGNTIGWASSGKMGFKGSKKNTPFAAQVAAESVAKQAFDLGLRDRKSTRLNSSHVAISYAVFCLKKKKKK